MQVYEFRETPEPMIVMDYYPAGNIMNVDVFNEELYISAMGQILDGLSHLHKTEIAHRDLKPENLLIKTDPVFKIAITDFGFAKVAPTSTWLKTFCGTLKYLAPEVFPGISSGHGPKVDIWSLGVIVLEWIYGIPTTPAVPEPNKKGQEVTGDKWQQWARDWALKLINKLKDEDDGQVVEILLHMIKIVPHKRWPAEICLARGFQNSLFKRRPIDGLVVCSNGPDDFPFLADKGDNDGTTTPTTKPAASPLAATDPGSAVVEGSLWSDGGSAISPSGLSEQAA